MLITRPISDWEDDLLTGFEHQSLIVDDLDGNQLIALPAPKEGWTHELLEAFNGDELQNAGNGWEAYLGTRDRWIGSSEL